MSFRINLHCNSSSHSSRIWVLFSAMLALQIQEKRISFRQTQKHLSHLCGIWTGNLNSWAYLCLSLLCSEKLGTSSQSLWYFLVWQKMFQGIICMIAQNLASYKYVIRSVHWWYFEYLHATLYHGLFVHSLLLEIESLMPLSLIR